jgi:hypothetical protein
MAATIAPLDGIAPLELSLLVSLSLLETEGASP